MKLGSESYLFRFHNCVFNDFIYLFDRERESTSWGEQRAEEEGKAAPPQPLSREPTSGLDPRTLGS